MDVLLLDVVPRQAVTGAAQQLGGDELVESCSNYTDPDVLCNQFSFK